MLCGIKTGTFCLLKGASESDWRGTREECQLLCERDLLIVVDNVRITVCTKYWRIEGVSSTTAMPLFLGSILAISEGEDQIC